MKHKTVLILSLVFLLGKSFAQSPTHKKDTTTFYALSYVVGLDENLLISEIHEFDVISKSESERINIVNNFKIQNNRTFKQLCLREYPELVKSLDNFMELNLLWLFENSALAEEKREELIYRSDKKAIYLSHFEFKDPSSNSRQSITIE